MDPWETEPSFHPSGMPPAMQRVTADLADAWCDCGIGSGAPSDRHADGCRYRTLMRNAADDATGGDYPTGRE